MANGLANGNGGVMKFTLSQVLQFLGLVVAGLLAWGNLKTDIRAGFAEVRGTLTELDHRTTSLEHRVDRDERHR